MLTVLEAALLDASSPLLPFTGREEEIGFLRAVALRGEHQAAVVAGGIGVGKTRLAAEVVDDLALAGWTPVRVRASHASATVPLGAFADLIPDHLPEGATQLDVFRGIARAVASRRTDTPALLLVDDAHRLDDASAGLVAHLVSRGVFAILTVRVGDSVPSAVTALWKESMAARLELQPLSDDQTAHLIEGTLGGPIDAATARRLWRWTVGNPLFLREVLLTGLHSGVLAQQDGLWSWRGPVSVSARLAELIDARLLALPSGVGDLVELLAVGEPLELALLRPESPAVELALTVGVVEHEDVGHSRLRLAHPLFGEVVRQRITAGRMAQLHSTLAARLEATGALAGRDALRLAVWSLHSGRAPTDPALLVSASHQALVAGDHVRAITMAEAAGRAGAGRPALVAWAEACYWDGRHHDAINVLSTLDWSGHPPDVAARAAIIQSSASFWGLGDVDAAATTLRAASKALTASHWHHDVLAHRASLSFFSGRPTEAVQIGQAVLAAPDAGEVAKLRAVPALLGSFAVMGELHMARRLFDERLPTALAHCDELPELAGELALGRCLAEVLAGELAEADVIATAVYETTAVDADEFAPTWALLRGRIALARGAFDDARRWLREAVAGLALHDPASLRAWAHALSATVSALRGEVADARRSIEAAEATRNTAVRVYDCELSLASAWVLCAEGRATSARATALAAGVAADADGQSLLAAGAWHALARLGAPKEAIEPLAKVVASLDGPLPPAYLTHVRGLASHDGPLLDEAARAFAGCGALLLAAESAASAATCHAEAGRRGAALTSRARAAELARRCGGAITFDLADPDAELGRLTGREREVLELAARGLSNREIATVLYVSVRTVGNHLAHVYAKTGVPGRQSLRALLPGDVDRRNAVRRGLG